MLFRKFKLYTNFIRKRPYLHLGRPSGLFSFIYWEQNFVRISHISYTCYMYGSSYLPWPHLPNIMRWRIYILEFLVIKFSPATHFLLDPSILCSEALTIYFLLERETSSHP